MKIGRIPVGAVLAGAAATVPSAWLFANRTSAVVQAWQPSAHSSTRVGNLNARVFGHGPHTVLLLHGLGGSNVYWPQAYDTLANDATVIAPDLLGFAGSLDEDRASFTLDDHIEALDECLRVAAPETETLTIIAHSMGSCLAIEMALRNSDVMQKLVCAGAPIFPDRTAAARAISRSNPMARLLLLDETWAHRACRLNCGHRTIAGLLAALVEPTLPPAITRTASLHTWPAYRDSLDELVLTYDWATKIRRLDEAGIRATFLWGSDDAIGDIDYARTLAGPHSVVEVPSNGHHLPITDAAQLLRHAVGPS